MIRENRYLIFKLSDVETALTYKEKLMLKTLAQTVDDSRKASGKIPLECVVVESDWPEYEPTWDAIERRVDAKPGTQNLLNKNGQGHDFSDTGCYND